MTQELDFTRQWARQSNSASSTKFLKTLDELKNLNELKLTIFSNGLCSDSLYMWARVGDYKDGQSGLAQLLKYARSGEIFTDGRVHRQVVEAAPEIPGERHLALCYVSGHSGPPRNCRTVSIFSHNDIFLRGEYVFEDGLYNERGEGEFGETDDKGCKYAGDVTPSGSIRVRYDVWTTGQPSEFASSLIKLLISRQKLAPELTTYKDNRGQIASILLESSAALRDLTILPSGWREAYDFNVSFGRKHDDMDDLSIEARLDPLVSRLALGSLTEYHGLDDSQRSIYSQYFDTIIADAIKAACPRWKQLDNEKIDCR